jgi:hypothetical protein
MLLLNADVMGPAPRVKFVSGRILAKKLRKGTVDPVYRAQLALKLQRGEVLIGNLTAKQARWLTGTDVTVLAVMRRAIPPASRPRATSTRVTYRSKLSDSDLDLLVNKAGHGRVLAALDRVTQPPASNGGSSPSDQIELGLEG